MSVLRLAEKGFVVCSLLFFTDAILCLFNEANGLPATAPNPIKSLLSIGIRAITIFLIIAWRKRVIRIVFRERLLWALLGIALASMFWSDMPVTTLRSALVLVQITLFGVYFGTCYSLKEQLRLLAWTFGITVLLSLVFALVLPSYGVMGVGISSNTEQGMAHLGAWRGVYQHNNGLGRNMVLSAVVFLFMVTSSRRYRWVAWAGFGLSVGLILLSTSKTALIVFITIMFFLPLYRALRWNYTLAIPFFITVILVGGGGAILLVDNAETIVAAFGRNLTFSGRTYLWATLLNKVWEHPWLGYGYAMFWRGWEGDTADVWSIIGWEAPSAHNGFLDLWLSLGLLGLSVFVLIFIRAYLRAVTWVRLTNTVEGLWPLVYLTFLFLANLTESSLLNQNFLWTLYVAVILSMHAKSVNSMDSSEFKSTELKKSNRAQMALR